MRGAKGDHTAAQPERLTQGVSWPIENHCGRTLKLCRQSPFRLPVASPGRCEIMVVHRFMEAGSPPRALPMPVNTIVFSVSAARVTRLLQA